MRDPATPDPATLVITRVVRPGRLDRFRAWADRHDDMAAQAPGCGGSIRLEQAGGLHHLLYRFDNTRALDAWRMSADHCALLAEADVTSVGREQHETGGKVHFTLPSESSGRKWKIFVVTWLAVLPILLGISTATRLLLPQFPQVAQTTLSSLILTATLTWLVMPRVHRWSRFWQLQDARGQVQKGGDGG